MQTADYGAGKMAVDITTGEARRPSSDTSNGPRQAPAQSFEVALGPSGTRRLKECRCSHVAKVSGAIHVVA